MGHIQSRSRAISTDLGLFLSRATAYRVPYPRCLWALSPESPLQLLLCSSFLSLLWSPEGARPCRRCSGWRWRTSGTVKLSHSGDTSRKPRGRWMRRSRLSDRGSWRCSSLSFVDQPSSRSFRASDRACDRPMRAQRHHTWTRPQTPATCDWPMRTHLTWAFTTQTS